MLGMTVPQFFRDQLFNDGLPGQTVDLPFQKQSHAEAANARDLERTPARIGIEQISRSHETRTRCRPAACRSSRPTQPVSTRLLHTNPKTTRSRSKEQLLLALLWHETKLAQPQLRSMRRNRPGKGWYGKLGASCCVYREAIMCLCESLLLWSLSLACREASRHCFRKSQREREYER